MYLLESARQLFNSSSLAGNNYHGLMNQGATCYLNSVLQVLFMTKDFREAVTRFSDGNPHTEFIDHQLKDLFDDLQKYEAYTYNITKKLGINNVYEQRDAAEYFERVLRQSSPEASKIFYGLLANRITCHNCHTETDRDAPFWHLPLSLVESCSEDYSVVNGIEEFFRPSVLCGENQMYCDRCDDKADATLTDVIKHHPDVLILLLKRFEFNYDHMSYIKISCSVEVPYSLQITESHTYELYAVVDHFGNLRAGHYSATIRIQDDGDRWFHFDDTRVTLADEQLFQRDHTERSQTAYILFYRRKEVSGTQDFSYVSNSGSFQFVTSDHHDECRQPENRRKREEDEEETTAELCDDPVKVICTGKHKDETEIISRESAAAEESPPLSLNVDHSEGEVHVETLRNGGTGVSELDHKERVQDRNTGVDDVRQSRPDNNHQIKPEVSDRSEKKSYEDDPHDEELDKYRENTEKHQGGEENSFDPADVHDTKGKTDSDKPATEMCFNGLQDQEEVGESKENIKEDQSQKQGGGQSDHSDTLNMQEISVTHSADGAVRVERQTRNVMEDRRGKEGNIQAFMENQDHNGGVDHEDTSRLWDFVQNTAEKLNSTATAHEDFDKQTKEQENEGDPEQIQTRENSQKRLGSQRGERRIQEAGRNKIRAGSSQSDVRAGNRGVAEGEHRSQKSQPQITDEEIRQKTSEHSFNKGKTKKKSAKTKDSMDTLSTGVDSLTLNESTLQEQRTKRRKQKEDEICSEATRLAKFSVEVEAPGLEHVKKNRDKKKQSRKKKERSSKSAKPKKTCVCPLSFIIRCSDCD